MWGDVRPKNKKDHFIVTFIFLVCDFDLWKAILIFFWFFAWQTVTSYLKVQTGVCMQKHVMAAWWMADKDRYSELFNMKGNPVRASMYASVVMWMYATCALFQISVLTTSHALLRWGPYNGGNLPKVRSRYCQHEILPWPSKISVHYPGSLAEEIRVLVYTCAVHEKSFSLLGKKQIL